MEFRPKLGRLQNMPIVANSTTNTILLLPRDIDCFRDMDVVKNQAFELKKLLKNKRQLSFQALNLAMIVFSALMIWKSLMFVTKSESPVVVVLRYVLLIA